MEVKQEDKRGLVSDLIDEEYSNEADLRLENDDTSLEESNQKKLSVRKIILELLLYAEVGS